MNAGMEPEITLTTQYGKAKNGQEQYAEIGCQQSRFDFFLKNIKKCAMVMVVMGSPPNVAHWGEAGHQMDSERRSRKDGCHMQLNFHKVLKEFCSRVHF